jgi:hypothetical protein
VPIPAHTGLIFPQAPISLAEVAGRSVYGGYFPAAIDLSLKSSDLSGPHANVTFPATCQRILVSTRPAEELTLNHLPNTTKPVEETCVWYASRPSLVVFVVRTRGDGLLTIDSVDGAPVGQTIAEGRAQFETQSHILYRWRQSANSVDSFASMRATQRDNSLPYKSRVFEDFVPGAAPHYFVAE